MRKDELQVASVLQQGVLTFPSEIIGYICGLNGNENGIGGIPLMFLKCFCTFLSLILKNGGMPAIIVPTAVPSIACAPLRALAALVDSSCFCFSSNSSNVLQPVLSCRYMRISWAFRANSSFEMPSLAINA